MSERPGCLSSLLKLFLLDWLFDWLQNNVGFGRGCRGSGCGVLLLLLFVLFACSIIFNTNWLDFGF